MNPFELTHQLPFRLQFFGSLFRGALLSLSISTGLPFCCWCAGVDFQMLVDVASLPHRFGSHSTTCCSSLHGAFLSLLCRRGRPDDPRPQLRRATAAGVCRRQPLRRFHSGKALFDPVLVLPVDASSFLRFLLGVDSLARIALPLSWQLSRAFANMPSRFIVALFHSLCRM